ASTGYGGLGVKTVSRAATNETDDTPRPGCPDDSSSTFEAVEKSGDQARDDWRGDRTGSAQRRQAPLARARMRSGFAVIGDTQASGCRLCTKQQPPGRIEPRSKLRRQQPRLRDLGCRTRNSGSPGGDGEGAGTARRRQVEELARRRGGARA